MYRGLRRVFVTGCPLAETDSLLLACKIKFFLICSHEVTGEDRVQQKCSDLLFRKTKCFDFRFAFLPYNNRSFTNCSVFLHIYNADWHLAFQRSVQVEIHQLLSPSQFDMITL